MAVGGTSWDQVPGLVRSARARPNGRRRRRERCLHEPEHLLPRALGDRLQAAELEPRQLDSSLRAHGLEAEVGQKIAREHRAVDEEPLVRGLALRVPVGERLERTRLLVARVPDRGQEERLHDPRARAAEHVGARDEHGIVRRRSGGQLPGAREELGRPVLHRADHGPVVVAVHGAPGAPVQLGALDPAPLVDAAARARLPPDALVTDLRRLLERHPGQARDPRAHGTDPRTSSVASGRAKKRNGTNVVPRPGETWSTPPGRR